MLLRKKELDYTNFNADYVPYFSGYFNDDSNTGTFQLNVNYDASNTDSNVGGH